METPIYRHLLLALDFAPESAPVVSRAQSLRGLFAARLSLLHVLEPIPPAMDYMPLGLAGEMSTPNERPLEGEFVASARGQLAALGTQIGVPESDQIIRVGPIAHTIEEVASEVGADLILIGSRGRHGLLGLFGSTAKALLRSPRRDVLCVRIGEPK